MKPITVYCAFCHRPRAGQKHLTEAQWTCIRQARAVWHSESGSKYEYVAVENGMECDDWFHIPK